uniref:Uncharacterized protein n=1 Tax=Anguilla anguilla TaxID=7936 RepID=A0A0E9UKP7_ANGAN
MQNLCNCEPSETSVQWSVL